MTSVNPADVGIRPATANDEPFLKRVHEAARHWEFKALLEADNSETYHTIMDQQFGNQQTAYFDHYDEAQYSVITWSGKSVGRLYANYEPEEVRILDIAVLPEYRNHGIGQVLLQSICLEAGMRRVPVRLSVHYMNQAKRLYHRLGFQQYGTNGPMQMLEWYHPDPELMMQGYFNPTSLLRNSISTTT